MAEAQTAFKNAFAARTRRLQQLLGDRAEFGEKSAAELENRGVGSWDRLAERRSEGGWFQIRRCRNEAKTRF